MKRILHLVLIMSGLALASCSVYHDADLSANRLSPKLTARQTLVIQNQNTAPVLRADNAKAGVAGSAVAQTSSEPQAIAALPSTDQKTVKTHAKKTAFYAKTVKRITQTFANADISRQAESILRKPGGHATAWNPGSMDTSEYLKLWIIFLVAAVVFLVLSEVIVSTSILSAIFGVLLLIALVCFLACLGIWLWRKSKEGKNAPPPSGK